MHLVGDIGGTYTRLAMAQNGTLVADSFYRFVNADFNSPDAVIKTFLKDAPEISQLCLAAAGPVVGHSLKMTNYPWELERLRLTARTGGAHVTLVNDMQGQGHGLDSIAQDARRHLAGPAKGTPGRACLVNLGTGLNVAVVHRIDGRSFVPPSEAGHMYLDANSHRVAEDYASGRALADGRNMDDMAAALTVYLHNIAHVHLPTEGIFMTGGLAQVLVEKVDWASLHEQMCGQGPYRDLLAAMPLYLVTDDRIALRGAARIAAGLTL